MTTKEAWLKMIFLKGVDGKPLNEILGVTQNSLYIMRSQAKNHEIFPHVLTMEEQLEKAGWKVVQEKQWNTKN